MLISGILAAVRKKILFSIPASSFLQNDDYCVNFSDCCYRSSISDDEEEEEVDEFPFSITTKSFRRSFRTRSNSAKAICNQKSSASIDSPANKNSNQLCFCQIDLQKLQTITNLLNIPSSSSSSSNSPSSQNNELPIESNLFEKKLINNRFSSTTKNRQRIWSETKCQKIPSNPILSTNNNNYSNSEEDSTKRIVSIFLITNIKKFFIL